MWSILAYYYPVDDNKNKTSSSSRHFNKFNLEGLEFPMKVKDIPKFKTLNTQSAFDTLNLNVFKLTGTVLTPIHFNKNYFQQQIDLLLYQSHHCLITKLQCLINKSSLMKHVCRRCLTAFSSEPVIRDHMERCINQQPTNITFIRKDHLKVEDHYMNVNVPIRVYADFECIIQPTQNPNVLFKQIPIAVGFYLKTPTGNNYYSYFDEGCTGGQQSCVEWFVDEMLILEHAAKKYFKTNLELQITLQEEETFQQSTICWLCEEPFTEGKVRDHDHLTVKYRGAAHNKCNINCKKSL